MAKLITNITKSTYLMGFRVKYKKKKTKAAGACDYESGTIRLKQPIIMLLREQMSAC